MKSQLLVIAIISVLLSSVAFAGFLDLLNKITYKIESSEKNSVTGLATSSNSITGFTVNNGGQYSYCVSDNQCNSGLCCITGANDLNGVLNNRCHYLSSIRAGYTGGGTCMSGPVATTTIPSGQPIWGSCGSSDDCRQGLCCLIGAATAADYTCYYRYNTRGGWCLEDAPPIVLQQRPRASGLAGLAQGMGNACSSTLDCYVGNCCVKDSPSTNFNNKCEPYRNTRSGTCIGLEGQVPPVPKVTTTTTLTPGGSAHGGPCVSSADCRQGYCCITGAPRSFYNNQCHLTSYTHGGTCLGYITSTTIFSLPPVGTGIEGNSCTSNAYCNTGLCCITDSTDSRFNNQCHRTSIFTGGRCMGGGTGVNTSRELGTPGTPCTANTDCSAGLCCLINSQRYADIYDNKCRAFDALSIPGGECMPGPFNPIPGTDFTPTPENPYPATATSSCTDTDGGKNYYTRGSTSVQGSHSGGSPGTDYCTNCVGETSGEKCIVEHYCQEGNPFNIVEECPGGCSNGKCNPTTLQITGTCQDTDAGRDYYTKGTTWFKPDGGGGIVGITDTCCQNCLTAPSQTGDYVRENYCENGELSWDIVYQCPNGCSNGACIGTASATLCPPIPPQSQWTGPVRFASSSFPWIRFAWTSPGPADFVPAEILAIYPEYWWGSHGVFDQSPGNVGNWERNGSEYRWVGPGIDPRLGNGGFDTWFQNPFTIPGFLSGAYSYYGVPGFPVPPGPDILDGTINPTLAKRIWYGTLPRNQVPAGYEHLYGGYYTLPGAPSPPSCFAPISPSTSATPPATSGGTAGIPNTSYCPDINKDGVINTDDVLVAQSSYNKANCSPYDCDLDNDGKVTVADLLAVGNAAGKTPAEFPGCQAGGGGAGIPSLSTTTTTTIGATIGTTLPTTISCTDSDGGLNYNSKGTVNSITNIGSYTSIDACSGNTLLEFYCKSNQVSSVTYPCPNGYVCYNGACYASTTSTTISTTVPPTASCTDSDGMNYNVQGSTSVCEIGQNIGSCSKVMDACNGNILIEGYCTGNQRSTTSYTCPNSCSNGACIQVTGSSPPCGSYGDVDGDGKVTSIDANLVLQYEAGLNTGLDVVRLARADVNADGKINSVDSNIILQYVSGTIKTFTAVCQTTITSCNPSACAAYGAICCSGSSSCVAWWQDNNNCGGCGIKCSIGTQCSLNIAGNYQSGASCKSSTSGISTTTTTTIATGTTDTTKPISSITTPAAGSTQTANFYVSVSDSDVGGSGLKCYYAVTDYTYGFTVPRTERKCNSNILITVGPTGNCRTTGTSKCTVRADSMDGAGNLASINGRSFSISYGATGGLSSTTTTLLKTTTTIKTTTTTTLPKTTTTIFYAAPYCPDINRNGVIDTNDVSLVQNAYSQTNCSPYDCDLNNDGLVSIDDIIAVSDAVSSSPLKYPC